MIWEEGVGKIFIQDKRRVQEYPNYPTKEYVPQVHYELQELHLRIAVQVLEWQQYIDSLAPSLKRLSSSERKGRLKQRMMVKDLNEKLYKILLDSRDEYLGTVKG